MDSVCQLLILWVVDISFIKIKKHFNSTVNIGLHNFQQTKLNTLGFYIHSLTWSDITSSLRWQVLQEHDRFTSSHTFQYQTPKLFLFQPNRQEKMLEICIYRNQENVYLNISYVANQRLKNMLNVNISTCWLLTFLNNVAYQSCRKAQWHSNNVVERLLGLGNKTTWLEKRSWIVLKY